MKRIIKTFWGDVEFVEVDSKHCKAILNGNVICEFKCSLTASDEKILQRFHAALNEMKQESYYK